MLFTDALISFLNQKMISPVAIEAFQKYIVSEGFETDTIYMDIEHNPATLKLP